MCGIAGLLTTRDTDGTAAGQAMASALRHRGPDAAGVWADPSHGIVLAHRRLAILDLSEAGNQPMVSPTGRYVISYNGEIYNVAELRAALVAGGWPLGFRGHSDTEILLAAVDVWGLRGAVERTVGMFAFGLWDRQEATLSLVRDRLGEKPLYYGTFEGGVVFASELKAFHAVPHWHGRVSRPALDLLLRYDCVPAPLSIYERVYKLAPGEILTLRRGDEALPANAQPYWSARMVFESGAAQPFRGTDREAVDELEQRLQRAVSTQMVADVPLGAFLSGGIDSSLVVALMQAQAARPVRTFTVGFREAGFDEAQHARAVAEHLGTDHTEVYLSGGDALAVVPTLPRVYDEPFADASQIPTMLIAKVARAHVTVALSGDGGDELFGGYGYYRRRLATAHVLRLLPERVRRSLASALRAVERGAGTHDSLTRLRLATLTRRLEARTAEARYHVSASRWTHRLSPVLGYADSASPTPVAAWAALPRIPEMMMFQDLIGYLPNDILVKVDRATMAVGLESRAPFLDHRVAEFAARLPLGFKLREHEGKWVLRELLARYVPRPLFTRPKHGFGPPIREWLLGPLRGWAGDLLAEDIIGREGFLDPRVVRQVWGAFRGGAGHRAHLVWTMVMFQAWVREQRDAERAPANVSAVAHVA